VAVLYTNKLVARLVIGVAEPVAVKATRGVSNPLSVLLMSNIADASGDDPVAFIPTFCALAHCATPTKKRRIDAAINNWLDRCILLSNLSMAL
jgi:hypothetical protein